MEHIFLDIVNLSIRSSLLILAVIGLRLVFRKAPKWIFCLLWGLVAIRLIVPFSFETNLSLAPQANVIPDEILYSPVAPTIHSGIYEIDEVVNHTMQQSLTPNIGASVNPAQVYSFILAVIWGIGIFAMISYFITSTLKLSLKLKTATRYEDNIMQCDTVSTPFVFGLMKPKIYLPYSLRNEDIEYIIAHEKAHISRLDYIWKPIGFILLSIYWFNPIMWISYILLCRDIESACDEKVIKNMKDADRKSYSYALLNCSIGITHRTISACPIAFGETGVKTRIKDIMSYKKPAIWIIILAVFASVVAIICFMTSPKGQENEEPDLSFLNYKNCVSIVAETEQVEAIYYPEDMAQGYSLIMVGYAESRDFLDYISSVEWSKAKAPKSTLQSPGSIEFIIEDDYRITIYNCNIAMVTYNSDARYYKLGKTDYDSAVNLFKSYYASIPTAEKWFDILNDGDNAPEYNSEYMLDEATGTKIIYSQHSIEVMEGNTRTPMLYNMKIWNIFICDCSGDGYPEICVTFSRSPNSVKELLIYDYNNNYRHEYSHNDDGYDISFRLEDEKLCVDKNDISSDIEKVAETGVVVYIDGEYGYAIVPFSELHLGVHQLG